ncbi:hypothetical protein IMZ48_24700 [Candidatus Bathyarchaeota archaeon]|nr:hypothetical protein [Candidatus Bathyarchaeota archaeon]
MLVRAGMSDPNGESHTRDGQWLRAAEKGRGALVVTEDIVKEELSSMYE